RAGRRGLGEGRLGSTWTQSLGGGLMLRAGDAGRGPASTLSRYLLTSAAQCHVLDVPTLTGAFGTVFIIPTSNRSLVCWRRPRSCTRHAAQHGSNRIAAARV